MEKISVIVTCYNKEKYISSTIDSVLKQTYTNIELIIIDDGSSDNSVEIISKYQDPRIRFFKQLNKGENAARNAGIKCATGSFIAFLDGDDIWISTKLQEQMNYIKSNNLLMCFCDYDTIDELGSLNNTFKKITFNNFNYNVLREKILVGNCILGSASSVLVSKTLVDKLGFFEDSLKWGGDWEYWIRIVFATDKIGLLSSKLVLIRFGIVQVQNTLLSEKRMSDTLKILYKSLGSLKLSKKERSSLYGKAVKTIYSFKGSYNSLVKNYIYMLKEDILSIFSFDIFILLIKYPLRSLKNLI